eukprot:CAMPEP_0113654998 /NCGR_PEP_ID=MMETSP0017_2-20120614/29455_1 /TAXON_ID=2856 /ORGANISM="Cylindrotheca closterium" /LENGTH=599 /DNA_ID=CAMNT_0000568183 /DNA_START=84 /DNA_END=1883 /DNA_ORIENTATION=+ /assembly_acc=CAM_ASM_000147
MNNQSASASASLPPSSRASTTGSQRAEKQASSRISMFRIRSPFLVGGESKSRVSNVARMPSRRSIMSDVESGGILRDKQQPRQRDSVVGSLQRNESQMSIPGAFRMHANGAIDDDPTVYSQNTKETNPFVIDHASLIDNPNLHAHLASGGAIPTDHPYTNGATGGPTPNSGAYPMGHPYTNGATGGPTPNSGAYPMPSYALNRITTPMAMPSLTSDAPIGVGLPVPTRRNQDGLSLNRRQLRLMFFMLAVAVGALITGVVAAVDDRSKQQEIPVNSAVESSPSNEKPLDWNDDVGYSNDAKDVMDKYINEDVFPTLSPTVLIKDSRAYEPTAAPSVAATSKPTIEESRSPTQSPSTPYPTPLPTTPKPTEPFATPEPSSAPTEPRPSSSPSTPFPSQSPTLFSSSTPSVAATTDMPTTGAPSQFPSTVVPTFQSTTSSPTAPPSAIILEMERTVGLNNGSNTTESDNGDPGQNTTNTTGSGNGDAEEDNTNTTGSGDGDIGQNSTNTTGEGDGDIGQNTTNTTGSGNGDAGQNSTNTTMGGQNATNTTGSGNDDVGQNSTNTTEEGSATMNGHNVTQDSWRGKASIASTGDATPFNWSQ